MDPHPALAAPDRLRWTGFGGVALLTPAAWVGAVASSPGVVASALAAGVAGIGLLVLSWALLGRAPLPSPSWLLRTLALWCGPLLVAPPLFSRDVFSYLAQGEVAARGLDPNAVGPATGLGAASEVVGRVGSYWRDTPSPYGPLFGAVERVVAEVSAGDPVAGVLLHRLVCLLGLVLIGWAVPRLAAVAGASRRTALWLGVLNPLVLWHLVGGAHNDSVMLGLMLAGTAVALEGLRERVDRWAVCAGVVLISSAALVKLPALAALAGAAVPGGAVSVLVANRFAAVLHRAIAGRLVDARRLLDDEAGQLVGTRDPLLRRFDVAGLEALVLASGLKVELLQGHGVVSDLVPGSVLDANPGAAEALAELELAASTRPPLRDVAARLHVLGRKSA
ncbi:polyprenol phosphomannose-dependent alpha 1,6 mannosyltransferase MptB [Saccharothrix sp. MB29]|nr:polyprenol phosphomannose-dependent alpha 1,6 mannosyltransferase MptB [Saccharothrix sp. MB29]